MLKLIMELIFDKTLQEWAKEFYIDFNQLEFNLCKGKNILTISEFEIGSDGSYLYACMYSFVKINNKFHYIPYGSKEYSKHFPSKENYLMRKMIFRLNTKKFIEFIRETPQEEYIITEESIQDFKE